MPDLFEENRIRDSSAENEAPVTPTVSMKSSMRYCLEGRAEDDADVVVGSGVGGVCANAVPDSVDASRMASRAWCRRMDGVMRGPRESVWWCCGNTRCSFMPSSRLTPG